MPQHLPICFLPAGCVFFYPPQLIFLFKPPIYLFGFSASCQKAPRKIPTGFFFFFQKLAVCKIVIFKPTYVVFRALSTNCFRHIIGSGIRKDFFLYPIDAGYTVGNINLSNLPYFRSAGLCSNSFPFAHWLPVL